MRENKSMRADTVMETDEILKADIVIIGGGPAGLAAAVAAKEAGVTDIVILERDQELGGILNQCIHNGFGLHTFKEELTGPEYAARFVEQVKEHQIPYMLHTMVVDIRQAGKVSGADEQIEDRVKDPSTGQMKSAQPKIVTAMNQERGIFEIETQAVILAMGCRERPRGALNIPGYRPAGIYSAGTAQHYVNIEGKMPGKEVVILGSGDIGLIMARRMTLEGAKVKVVAELMSYSGGLKRNIAQCLNDFDIPLKLSHTVIDIAGKERVEGVTLARVDEHLKPIPGTEEYIPCDTLLLSVGLIPENELSAMLGVEMNAVTSGPLVNESLETDITGVFACGNVLHVHDLVDYVSEEAKMAGENAAKYILGNLTESVNEIPLKAIDGVRYTVPSRIDPNRMADEQVVRFRVGNTYQDVYVALYYNDQLISRRKKRVMAPGEMESLKLKKQELLAFKDLHEITIKIEQN